MHKTTIVASPTVSLKRPLTRGKQPTGLIWPAPLRPSLLIKTVGTLSLKQL